MHVNHSAKHTYTYNFVYKEEFYSDKNSTKKYSVGIIDMIKLRSI